MDWWDYHTYGRGALAAYVFILGSIIYSIKGLRELLILKKTRVAVFYILFITIFPIALYGYFELVVFPFDEYYRIWIGLPLIFLAMGWLFSGYFINDHAQKVKKGIYIPFYKVGTREKRLRGLGLLAFSSLIWAIAVLGFDTFSSIHSSDCLVLCRDHWPNLVDFRPGHPRTVMDTRKLNF